MRETQLFNLKENPFEYISEHGQKDGKLTDLAEDPAHADKLKEMEALLLSEMRKHNDPYRLWNQPKDGLTPLKPSKKAPKKRKQK